MADVMEQQNEAWNIATTSEIAVGCTLAFMTALCLLVLLYKTTSCWKNIACFCCGSSGNLEKYETIKENDGTLAGNRFSSQFSFGRMSLTGEKNDLCTSQLETEKNEHTSDRLNVIPSPISQRSPALTRAHRHIPFELPPTNYHCRIIEPSPVQPDVAAVWPRKNSKTADFLSPRSQHGSDDSLSSARSNSTCDLSQSKSPISSLKQLSPKDEKHMEKTGLDYSANIQMYRSTDQYRNNVLGKIQPELYRFNSEYNDADILRSRCGRIWFSIVYDGTMESLTVKVIKVKQLPPRPHNENPRDSFVKLFLLPDERISQQTKVRARINNPLFNETFIFQVSDDDIKQRNLRLSVYDVEKRKSTRHLLGHALVSLKDIDPSKPNEVLWRDLDDIAHPGDTGNSLGEVSICLTYHPNFERLTVVVVEARNLRKMDLEETGIYVKVSLAQGHHVIKSKRTVTQNGVSDPRYNESFSFKVTAKDMEQSCLTINVVTTGGIGAIHKVTSSIKNTVTGGRYGAEHTYGCLAIGSFMHCRGEQLLHWQDVVGQPKKSISRWHALSESANSH